jgi:hypothetical protein
MKKLFTGSLILSLSFAVSCDDNVDPTADLREEYAFYCILNADTTFQTAYLSKAYEVLGENPLENQADPAVRNASVVITYKNKDYLLADSSVGREDVSRYKDDFNFYYNNKLNLKSEKIYDIASPVTVTVTLPNNKVLTSATETIPAGDLLVQDTDEAFKNRPDVYERFCVFSWDFWSSKNSIKKYYFLPMFEINYSKIENGIPVRKKVLIPSYTYYYNGNEYYSYPKISKDNSIIYNREYVIDFIKNISADDPVKSNYIIHNMMMTVVLMDKNLAAYAALNTTFDSEFSVRLDPPDASNINGGYGMFGLYAKKRYEVISDDFAPSLFGYRYDHKL